MERAEQNRMNQGCTFRSTIVFWWQTGNSLKPNTLTRFTSNRKWHRPTRWEENRQSSNRNNDSMNVKPQSESQQQKGTGRNDDKLTEGRHEIHTDGHVSKTQVKHMERKPWELRSSLSSWAFSGTSCFFRKLFWRLIQLSIFHQPVLGTDKSQCFLPN